MLKALFDKLLSGGSLSYYKPPGEVRDGNLKLIFEAARQAKHNALDLSGARLRGSGMKKLRAESWLRGLKLCYADVNDVSLAELAGAKLEVLDLSDIHLTGLWLQKVNGNLPKLRELHMRAAQVDDRILPYLLKLEGLQVLDVSKTKMTGKVVGRLVGLPNLKTLKMKEVELDTNVLASLTDRKGVKIEWDLD